MMTREAIKLDTTIFFHVKGQVYSGHVISVQLYGQHHDRVLVTLSCDDGTYYRKDDEVWQTNDEAVKALEEMKNAKRG